MSNDQIPAEYLDPIASSQGTAGDVNHLQIMWNPS